MFIVGGKHSSMIITNSILTSVSQERLQDAIYIIAHYRLQHLTLDTVAQWSAADNTRSGPHSTGRGIPFSSDSIENFQWRHQVYMCSYNDSVCWLKTCVALYSVCAAHFCVYDVWV